MKQIEKLFFLIILLSSIKCAGEVYLPDFNCETFLFFQNAKGKEDAYYQEVDWKSSEINDVHETSKLFFSCDPEVPEGDIISKGTFQRKINGLPTSNIMYIHFYKSEMMEPEEDKTYMFCFELISMFSINTFNYFQCTPFKATAKIKPENPDKLLEMQGKLYFDMMDELRNMIEHVAQKITEQIHEKDVLDILLGGVADMQIEGGDEVDKSALEVGKFLTDNSLEGKENDGEPINKTVVGDDGIFFYFRIRKLPFAFLKGIVYKASPDYLRLIILSNNQEYDLYISRFVTEGDNKAEFLKTKYNKELVNILEDISGTTVRYEGTSKKPVEEVVAEETLPNILHKYKGTNLMSFPLSFMVIHHILRTEHHCLNLQNFTPKDIPEGEENLEEDDSEPVKTFENMDTERWFYINPSDNFTSAGKLFEQQEINFLSIEAAQQDNVAQTDPAIELNAQEFNNEVKDVFNEYQTNLKNYAQKFYVLPNIHRKMVVNFYGYEDEFYKSLQIKFITQFFVSEFILPFSGVADFYESSKNIVDEVIEHYKEIVLGTDNLPQGDFRITEERFEIAIGKVTSFLTLNSSLCVKKPEEGAEETDDFMILEYLSSDVAELNKVRKTLAEGELCNEDKHEEMKDKTGEIIACTGDIAAMRPVLQIIKKKDVGNNKKGFLIKAFEPSSAENNKSLSSQYQLFDEYPYNYQDVLDNYLKSTFCHLITSSYKRRKIEEDVIKGIFDGSSFGEKPKEKEDKAENRKLKID